MRQHYELRSDKIHSQSLPGMLMMSPRQKIKAQAVLLTNAGDSSISIAVRRWREESPT
jgi:hypothetical protein